MTLADDLHERCDHLGVEADFLSFLCLKEPLAVFEGDPQVERVRAAAGRFAGQYVARSRSMGVTPTFSLPR